MARTKEVSRKWKKNRGLYSIEYTSTNQYQFVTNIIIYLFPFLFFNLIIIIRLLECPRPSVGPRHNGELGTGGHAWVPLLKQRGDVVGYEVFEVIIVLPSMSPQSHLHQSDNTACHRLQSHPTISTRTKVLLISYALLNSSIRIFFMARKYTEICFQTRNNINQVTWNK